MKFMKRGIAMTLCAILMITGLGESNYAKADVFGPTIVTDSDFAGSTEYPIVAQVGKPLAITITDYNAAMFMLYLVGNNGFKKEVVLLQNKLPEILTRMLEDIYDYYSRPRSIGILPNQPDTEYYWYPWYTGIFDLVVCDVYGNALSSRKIYIRPFEANHFYELGDVSIPIDGTEISAQVVNQPDELTNYLSVLNNDTISTLSIGEDIFWHRTIKPSAFNSETNSIQYKYKEDYDLSAGNYQIAVGVKGIYSIENEDTKTVYYNKIDSVNTIDIDVINDADDVDNCIEVLAKTKNENGLMIACVVSDETGSRIYQDYREIKYSEKENGYFASFAYNSVPWDRTFTIRVKNVEEGTEFPRSYEQSVSVFVDGIEDSELKKKLEPGDILVDIVDTSYEDYLSTQDGDKSSFKKEYNGNSSVATVLVNNKNYIYVSLADGVMEENFTYSYLAYAVDDQTYIRLMENEIVIKDGMIGRYLSNNAKKCFLYIPLSGIQNAESHKLVVSVFKRNAEGTVVDKTARTITLNVSNSLQ